MGLINWAVTYALFGKEKADLVASLNYMDVQAQMRHEEIMEEMRRENLEKVSAMEAQQRELERHNREMYWRGR